MVQFLVLQFNNNTGITQYHNFLYAKVETKKEETEKKWKGRLSLLQVVSCWEVFSRRRLEARGRVM